MLVSEKRACRSRCWSSPGGRGFRGLQKTLQCLDDERVIVGLKPMVVARPSQSPAAKTSAATRPESSSNAPPVDINTADEQALQAQPLADDLHQQRLVEHGEVG